MITLLKCNFHTFKRQCFLVSKCLPNPLLSLLCPPPQPIAAGSGIPQIKCYLNGVKIPRVVRLKVQTPETHKSGYPWNSVLFSPSRSEHIVSLTDAGGESLRCDLFSGWRPCCWKGKQQAGLDADYSPSKPHLQTSSWLPLFFKVELGGRGYYSNNVIQRCCHLTGTCRACRKGPWFTLVLW